MPSIRLLLEEEEGGVGMVGTPEEDGAKARCQAAAVSLVSLGGDAGRKEGRYP